jgi:hypothetical protein
MFVRTTIGRNKDGSTRVYLHLVRGFRVNGKVRQQVVASLGRLDLLQESGGLDRLIASLARFSERCWVEAEAQGSLAWAKLYGPVLVFRWLWERLGLAQQLREAFANTEVQYQGEEAVFAMVLNRIMDPHSKRGTHAWMETVYRPQWDGLELHHLYRALDVLSPLGPTLEEGLFAQVRDLFHLDLTLMLFDTTAVYFEGEGPQGLAEYGYSRDHRPDLRQMVVGLLLTREGIPICHRVFPGNTVDARAFQQVVGELKPRFRVQRVVLVGDRGLVSQATMEALERAGMDFILGMPLRRFSASREVLSRAGRYHEVAENLRVKEVWVEGERYILCHNPQAAERDRLRREELLAQLREKLARGGVGSLLKSAVHRRFLKVKGAEAHIDMGRVAADARLDGKWVLDTNTVLPSDEVALAYKGLWRVEQAFRQLKSGLEVRPVFHWTEERVRGHVLVCFLALVLESALQRLLKEQESSVSYREAIRGLEQVMAVRYEAQGKAWLWRTELGEHAYDAFQAVGMRPPPRVQPFN